MRSLLIACLICGCSASTSGPLGGVADSAPLEDEGVSDSAPPPDAPAKMLVWDKPAGLPMQNWTAVWSAGDRIWLGASANVFRFDGTSTKQFTMPNGDTINDLQGNSFEDLWVVGSYTTYRYQAGAFKTLNKETLTQTAAWLSPSKALWVVVNKEYVKLLDDNTFTRAVSTNTQGIGIFGFDDEHVIIGGNTHIVHYDSGTWTTKAGIGAGVPAVKRMWGASPNDVWAVGQKGQIMHWDGTSWSYWMSDPARTADFTSIWGSGADDIWAVAGGLWHFDGTSWSTVDVGTTSLRAIHGTARDEFWIVGNSTVIHRTRK